MYEQHQMIQASIYIDLLIWWGCRFGFEGIIKFLYLLQRARQNINQRGHQSNQLQVEYKLYLIWSEEIICKDGGIIGGSLVFHGRHKFIKMLLFLL